MRERMLRAATIVSVLAVVLLPIYWLVATSLKPNREITQDGTLYPHAPSFDNYLHLFSQKQFGSYLINSLAVTAVSVAVALTLGTLGSPSACPFEGTLRLKVTRAPPPSAFLSSIEPPCASATAVTMARPSPAPS